MGLIEQFLSAKNGHNETCEDAIYIGPSFAAIIDGATSKTDRRWNGKTGGRIAAETLKEAFDHIPADATARQTVDLLTAAIQKVYRQYDLLETIKRNAVQRITASFVALSIQRKEVWFVGDCQCLLNQELIRNTKDIDEITANARALFLATEIAQGKTLEELRQHDTGREFILPLIERQMIFQNNPSAGSYWCSVIDGFHVPDEGIRILSLPESTETVVLASDGYPYLKDTLMASEQALQELLQDDPMLFRHYKTTKSVQQDNPSFDDRAYLKILLQPK